MKSKLLTSVAVAALLTATAFVPSFAQSRTATPTSVKIGYFNLQLVKASYPEAAGSESLRTQAENQLRRDVEEGNKRLQDAQKANKPKEEIEKMARELQSEINAKQQALIQLVQTQAAIATQNIAQAVNSVAKDRSLDLVVDGAGVFAGGNKIIENGEDITQAVITKLNQAANIRPTETGGGGGGGAAAR